MYVRLAFAVSAFLEPEILILDEILAVGDIGFRTKCFKRLEQLINGRHTILFVAHDTGLVTKFCDSALWLDKGSIKAFGPAETVAEGYQTAQRPSKENAGKSLTWRHRRICRHRHRTPRWRRRAKAITRVRRTMLVVTRLRASTRRRPKKAAKAIARIAIYDEFGQRMFSLSSLYGERQLPPLNDRARILCEIPKLPLLARKLSDQL